MLELMTNALISDFTHPSALTLQQHEHSQNYPRPR